ncbi:hypothetical protein FQA39_LY14620 [Lamprigera yunnana]|nr:hypothetical protein FQA39_LY14620 [Lamprigera yunnana]
MKETLPQTGNAITQVAQERDNLKRELQTSKHEIQMLKNRIDEPCVQEIETLENEIKRLRGRGYLSSDEETDIIRKEIEVLKKYCTKLACIQEENQKLKRQLEEGRRISNETAVPDSNIDTLKDELKENVANLKQVAAERDKLKEKVTLLERELTQHEDLLEDVETMKRKSQMLDCVSDECKKLRTSLQGMQKLESELKSMKKKACEAEKLQNELIAIKCEMERVKVQAAKELQAIKAKCEATVKERDNYKRMSVEATGMGEELKCLANCAKEADALKCERNSLKTELKKYSCLESQYKELIEKTKHLENIKAEREMYKIKYEEMLEMECHCEMLKVQVEKFKHMEKDRDVLIQQVQDCECCIAEQEGEIKKLIAHIDHMSKGSNDQQREVNNLKNELSQKNSLIGSTEGRLSCVQEQLKNTVKEVSCEAAFLRSRISDLEKALDKAARKTNVEPTRDVRGCEEQPQQLQKQQKLTKSTDVECDEDEYYKQVLTQSKMVVKRIAQELQKHYSDWSSAKRNVDSEAEVISLRKELTECKTVNAKLLKKEEEFKILVAEIKTLKKVSAELSNYTCAKQNDLEILNAENNALRKLSSEIQTSANVKVTDLKNANKRICELESELKELSVLKEKLEKCQTELKNEIKHRQEQECAYKKCMAESKSRAEATQNVEIELLTKEKEQLLDQIAKQREEIECMVVSTDLSCEKMQIEETEKEQMQKLISQLQQQIASMEKGADFYQINEAKCKIEAEEELKNRKRDERMEMERRISQNYEDKLGQKERDLKKLQNKYNDSMAKLQGSHEEVIRDINIEHEKQIESLCCELRACKAQIEQHKQSNQKITQGTSQEKISEANKGTMAGIDRSCLSKDTVENVNIRPNKVHKANAETSPKSKQYKCDCHLCTILEKIAHCGIESLDFEELKYLHSKTCEATSNLLRRSPTCRCTLNEGGDDPQLVKRIDVLQNDLFKKQKHTQQKVGALQIAVKMERERLQEFKSLLDTEKNRNSELMCKIGAQSRAVANIQAERDMIRKENLFNEEKHQSLLLHYGKEKAKIKKLEKDLERERMLRKRDTDSLMIDEKYCVVQFIHPNKCRDEIFSAVPSTWLTADGCCLWPKANVRSCIIKCKPPSKDWDKHAVKLCGKYGTYQLALRKERKLANYSSDSNTTESESLGRGLRIKKTFSKISEEHSKLESDQNGMHMKLSTMFLHLPYMFLDESDSSTTESIPSAVPDHDDFETIFENGHEEIIQPVANNETSAVILKQLIELKVICSRLDSRLETTEKMINTGKASVAFQNYSLPPNLPLNYIEELNSFEEVLSSADGKMQLTGAKGNFPLKELSVIQCLRGLLYSFLDLSYYPEYQVSDLVSYLCSECGKSMVKLVYLCEIMCNNLISAALKVNFVEMKEFEEMVKL